MKTIGIDIDDTLVKTNEKAIEIIKREGYKLVDYYEKVDNLSEFINKHFIEIVKTASLFENAKETIERLKDLGYRIVLISARAF